MTERTGAVKMNFSRIDLRRRPNRRALAAGRLSCNNGSEMRKKNYEKKNHEKKES